ncbi:MAG: hypothetical protein H8E71_04105 [Candidatus Marinimicrobia bacterium]|nr:hypothetical protein [Candidatus Neomarinimicrobiota bacterium]
MKKLILLFIVISIGYTSDQRINALGQNVVFWPDDDDIVTVFPHMTEGLSDNIFQVSNVNQNQHPSVKYYFGKKIKYGIILQDKSDAFGFYIATKNIGGRFSFDFDYESLDTTYSHYSEAGIDTTFTGQSVTPSIYVNAQIGWEFFKDVQVGLRYSTTTQSHTGDINLLIGDKHHLYSNIYFPNDSLNLNIGYTYFNSHSEEIVGTKVSALYAFGSEFVWSDVTKGNFGGSEDANYTMIGLNIPITLALEANVKDWLQFRAGLTKSWSVRRIYGKYTIQDGELVGLHNINNSMKIFDNDINAIYGLGLNYGRLTIDICINESIFTNPIQKVTGFKELGATSSATITYSW